MELDFIEKVWVTFISLLFLFLVLVITSPLRYNPNACANKYENSNYKLFGWCMVQYGSWYIPEELYQKQFIQNLSVDVK